ncbi:MAG: hypothetical protein BGN88_07755 [Clostridiales bacterium 43-6]|nr:MAG: hypothetical protein BGN88_07755 [Clostridiales bacterium 43-6]
MMRVLRETYRDLIKYFILTMFCIFLFLPLSGLFLYCRQSFLRSSAFAAAICFVLSFIVHSIITFRKKPNPLNVLQYAVSFAPYLISLLFLLPFLGLLMPDVWALVLCFLLSVPFSYYLARKALTAEHETISYLENALKWLIAIAVFAYVSYHIRDFFYHSKFLYGAVGRDNHAQYLYYLPFLQKAIINHQPFWSWSFGLGGDVFGTFGYYYTTNPFFYLSVLCRRFGFFDWSLAGLLLWRLRLAVIKQIIGMLCMYGLLRYEKRSFTASLLGSLVYGGVVWFSNYSLLDDFMADSLIYLPLLILGYQYYKITKKPWLFILFTAITLANNFYFAYMDLLFFGTYLLVHTEFGTGNLSNRLKTYGRELAKTAGFIIVALLLSAVAFLPVIISFFHADRFNIDVDLPLFYERQFYFSLSENLFSSSSLLGFPVIVLIGLLLNYKKCSTETRKKSVLAFFWIICFCIPLVSSVMNWFSFMTIRWLYLVGFAVAYALADWLDENRKHRSIGLIKGLILTGIVLSLMLTKFERTGIYVNSVDKKILIYSIWIIILLVGIRYIKISFLKSAATFIMILLCIVPIVSNNSAKLQSPEMGKLMEKKNVETVYQDTPATKELFDSLTPKSNEFYRTEIFEKLENNQMYLGSYGTGVYNSLIDKGLHKTLKSEYVVADIAMSPSRYSGLDNRLVLQTLFGVKYNITTQAKDLSNCSFSKERETGPYSIYGSNDEYFLGFGFWYDSVMDSDRFTKMNAAEKDGVVLQTAVVSGVKTGLPQTEPEMITVQAELDLGKMAIQNGKYQKGSFVLDKGSVVTIPIKNYKENGEYLISYENENYNKSYNDIYINGTRTRVFPKGSTYAYPEPKFTVKDNLHDGTVRIQSLLKTDIKNLKVYYNPYEKLPDFVKARKKYQPQNLYVNGGNVSCTIKNDEKGILALSIPYKKGWTAKVDGKRVEILKVNHLISGLLLEKGNHKIQLTYITSGFREGLAITIITAISLLLAAVYLSRRSRRPQKWSAVTVGDTDL